MELYKDGGLLLGETVFNILTTSPGYRREDDAFGRIEISARAATLGGYSAYRFSLEHGPATHRYAWVKRNKVTDGIDVVLGTEATSQYDEKRGYIPLDDAIMIALYHDEQYQAAKAIYEFLLRGETSVQRIPRNPFQQ